MDPEKELNAAFERLEGANHAAQVYTAAMKSRPIKPGRSVTLELPSGMMHFNPKPECAMIGDMLIFTHFHTVSLFKLDGTVLKPQLEVFGYGRYKIAACKSKQIFFVATHDDLIHAVDLSGGILGSYHCARLGSRQMEGTNPKVPLSLACDDDMVSVIHTDNQHYQTLTVLAWNPAARVFERIGQLDMTTIGIDVNRKEAIQNEELEIPPSSARLLSPIQFTALHKRDNVPTLFQIYSSSAAGVIQAHPVRKVGLPVDFRCFANLESATHPGVGALLEDVRDQPPLLRFLKNLTPVFETQMRGISVALCSGDNDNVCTCRVVEHNDKFKLTVDKFKWIGSESSDRAFIASLAMRLARRSQPQEVRGRGEAPAKVYASIYPSRIYPTSGKPIPGMHLKQGGSRKKRKIVKRKVKKSRKH
jgi:hypothetical protein